MAHDFPKIEVLSTITYTYDPNKNIHEYIFHEATRKAVDEFLAHIMGISESSDETFQFFIVDVRESGEPPLRYLIRRFGERMARNVYRPPAIIAQLLMDHTISQIVISLVSQFMEQGQIRTFKDRDKAIDWLLHEQTERSNKS